MANVNYIQANGAAASAVPSLLVEGSDTNIDLQLTAKGTGAVRVGSKGTASATAGAATSSTQSGTITSEALTTAAGSDYTLTLTNTKISATSQIFHSLDNGTNTTAGIYVRLVTPGSGSAVFIVRNNHASSALNGTIKLSFLVV